MSEREQNETRSGRAPSDTESLVGETAASEPLTTRNRAQPDESASRPSVDHGAHGAAAIPTDRSADEEAELGHS